MDMALAVRSSAAIRVFALAFAASVLGTVASGCRVVIL
jgi:hypothetical protein